MDVVSLGARCEVAVDQNDPGTFAVDEFAVLDSGERVWFSLVSGFSMAVPRDDPWRYVSADDLAQSTRVTLVADSDVDERPWELISFVLRDKGVDVLPEQLRELPLTIEIGPRALSHLAGRHQPS